jgi:hypothetical protein
MTRTIWFDASTGEITLNGTVDGVDLAALAAKIIAHHHVLSGNVSSVSSGYMILTGSGGETTFYTGWGAEQGRGIDSHTHGVGTLATNVETASTAMSAKTDDFIWVNRVMGDLFCDLIDGVAPEVVYDRYDGHYHSVAGHTADTDLPGVHIVGASSYYDNFLVSAYDDGTNASYESVYCNYGVHQHNNNNISLVAYGAPSGAGSNDAGNPKFATQRAAGNILLRGDVNDIGIAQFYADYIAHVHTVTGATANYVSGQAGVHSAGGKDYFYVGGPVWVKAYIQRPTHSHNGTTLVVATPT